MNLEKILAISGKPGLYVLKVQTRTGFLVESLIDGKKITVNLKSNVSLLSEISMYSYEGEKPLRTVFENIAAKENNGEAISHKAGQEDLTAYFLEVFPDYDQDRVYISDIKKVLNWYNILQNKGYIEASPTVETEKSEEITA
ncbi:hypothetical protein B0A58_07870 [Flavobacterium branchiophilum NBRC 15030 = ATCC 35035]|uniref:Uncharacterized protein n=1 Tax=Flavobacterium branchiophilum TaxID=55197 RepID=A0A543G7Q7_9FLAO|nr:DUF5606 domain-containing protein [Flavobacterium branchiophilum]OXA75985.1 hypothetical protein B0A58_07870 [Flavobacterium branchiophilum NBRC 15030 = ATCC 35035]TQM42119.1 hypothetical protein BC670_3150 [Flavobacterium branchiophilum]GEM53892.1 hypothetical protein FB1_01130 [Flavobacterium branchiophilum NBRC 15030 = ATCC 35035]